MIDPSIVNSFSKLVGWRVRNNELMPDAGPPMENPQNEILNEIFNPLCPILHPVSCHHFTHR